MLNLHKNILVAVLYGSFICEYATTLVNKAISEQHAEVLDILTELRDKVSIYFANNPSQINLWYQPYISVAVKGLVGNRWARATMCGTTRLNQRLSLARANLVATVLVAQ